MSMTEGELIEYLEQYDRDAYEEYFTLTNGDSYVAINFLKNTYGEEKVHAAFPNLLAQDTLEEQEVTA